MSLRVNVRVSKIMCTPMKVGAYLRGVHQLSNPVTSNFLKAVFQKFYLVHSSKLCPKCF